ncbi:MAG TPA: 7TM diverse intracellular signaling domain-containing protein [Arenimonas sp.]|nr:7TM diverse intracellular signaling domain-containing protein [Arenimonas sp.]
MGLSAWVVLRRLLLIALLLLPAMAAAERTAALSLQPGEGRHELTPQLRWHYDGSAQASAEAMFAQAAGGDFEALPEGRATFGFQPGAFWFYAVLVNHDPDNVRRLLVQQYPLSDRIDLYQRGSDGAIRLQRSGDHLPFESRAVKHRQPNFWVDLPLGEPIEVLVRVESQSSMQVPLVLYTTAAFTAMAHDGQLVIGLYYGILLALLFYNLILWVKLRDRSYFWYMAHITAFGLVLFCLNGLAFKYLWPNNIWLQDRCVPISICLAQIGMQQFVRHFLGLSQRWREADHFSLAMIALFVTLGIVSIWMPYRLATTLASALVLPSVAWIAIVSVGMLRRGYTPARILLWAWAAYLVGTAAFTLVAFGVVPKMFLTEYGVQIGSAMEMILLSFALAYRYAALRNENEKLVHEANEQLERKVAERTSELQVALEQLAEINRRDGLTGVFNRHHFREQLESLLRDSRTGHRNLGVLMVDVDHFKRINDQIGHLAGDECLRKVAQTMRDTLEPFGGIVARFGGEEFVAALPGSNEARALEAAEAVRMRIAATPIEVEGQSVPVTVSVGVFSLDAFPLANANPEDALRRADAALYTAKEDGRNCVRRLNPRMDAPERRT